MTLRKSVFVLVVSAALAILHVVLVRAMAEGHVAHVLLGAGNGAPPIGAALLAVLLVIVRFLAVVVAPGAALAAVASIAAHHFVGPLPLPPADAGRAGQRAGGPASSGGKDRSSSDGAARSVSTGAGTSIGGRAT